MTNYYFHEIVLSVLLLLSSVAWKVVCTSDNWVFRNIEAFDGAPPRHIYLAQRRDSAENLSLHKKRQQGKIQYGKDNTIYEKGESIKQSLKGCLVELLDFGPFGIPLLAPYFLKIGIMGMVLF